LVPSEDFTTIAIPFHNMDVARHHNRSCTVTVENSTYHDKNGLSPFGERSSRRDPSSYYCQMMAPAKPSCQNNILDHRENPS